MVWDILISPWAEATVKFSIQDSFRSLHCSPTDWCSLSPCFTADGLILVDKLSHAVKDPPLSPHHEHWLARGSLAEPQPRRVLGLLW